MIKAILFISIFTLLSHSLLAQSGADTIGIRSTWLGTYYKYDGRNIGYHKIHKLLAAEPDALKIWKRAQTPKYVCLSLCYTGFVCFVASDYSFHRPYGNALFIAGTGLVIASIPFSVSFTHQVKKAVKVYNKNIGGVGYNETKVDFNLCFTGNGVGLIFKF
jgi:hypothetical protein